jgi:hypothetical protein
MKKPPLWGFILIAVLPLVSCPQTAVQAPYEDPLAAIQSSYVNLATRTFLAQNLTATTSPPYSVDSVLLAEGDKCLVWAARNAGVPIATGEAIAREYDRNIYKKIVGTFGSDDIMARGDMDKNGKLILFLLNIQDGFTGSGAYTAGYFNSADLFAKNLYRFSNESDMIYVDTWPSTLCSPESYATIAHELQHFINFTTRYTEAYNYSRMDTWIDEGLSSAAEYIYLGKHNDGRVSQFTQSKTVQQGNNFFVWEDNSSPSLLDDYSTVYLFFQWLRIQSGGTEIYKRIIESPDSDYRAVTGAISGDFAAALGSADWETTLRSWFAANYINSPAGPYGYHNELPTLKVYALGGSTQRLRPGEGVYSITGATPGALPTSEGSSNIKYAGLRSAADSPPEEAGVSLDALYPRGRLLTFNGNENNTLSTSRPYDRSETGVLTGEAGETIPRASSASAGRSAGQAGTSWVIDARDLMGRDRGDN